ncbi:DoxX family protein [Prolixibacter denitrificans]|uniref:Putative oxidoreductase n=1 Tax=Prolixibacter denitrificans TaxID=1541063 RepID=A0A2P8C863_9BACT|nr:DoxX family membrane protein [Prolixibacter denitrificans]PSK81132.1 putative oxidoreductase [Prolixibacter denitrificans]GET22249.1 hypothetical protein JCM18694_24950 [Prolixibacter denitrificans]
METKTIEINKKSVTVLRILLSMIFIVASIMHTFKVEKVVDRINHARFSELGYLLGKPEISVIASGIAMFIAGIALLIGFNTKYAAIVLALILIPITITIQVGQMSTIGPLFKNIAIFGGLMFFALNNNFNIFKNTKA